MADAPATGPARDEAEPVTRQDLRTLRRWTLVAGVWAVAATAVALIALLDTSRGEAEEKAEAAGARITRVERDVKGLRTLEGRVDELESRLGDLAPTADVTKLQDRVARAEEDASKAAGKANDADRALTDLEDRVQQLEDDAGDSGGAGDGGTGADSP